MPPVSYATDVCNCEQESFVNISVPKIEKDYSLYRTYVIFRTLGLRHLVVVDVHNRVVGIITRKDLMPFIMQERLESLLERNDVDDGGKNGRRKSTADSVLAALEETGVDSAAAGRRRSSDRDRDAAADKSSSANKATLDGLAEEDATDDVTALPRLRVLDSSAADNDHRDEDDDVTAVQLVVDGAPPKKNGKSDWV